MRFLAFSVLAFFVTAGATADDAKLRAIAEGHGNTAPLSGLQVSLMKAGKPSDGFVFGFALTTETGEHKLRRDHKIRIASISKLVAAIAVMQLVETGKIGLDDDVSDILGWQLRNPNFPSSIITPRQLLSHTSSIRDGSAYWLPAGENFRDFFTAGKPAFEDGDHFAKGRGREPGQYFTYANLNFGVLAALVEHASGERFDRYMTAHVFEPLGLEASYNPCDIAADQLAAAYRKRGPGGWQPEGPWHAQVDAGRPVCYYGMAMDDATEAQAFAEAYVPGSNPTIFSPQGGLRASADDLIVIMQMLVNGGEGNGNRIIRADSAEMMLAPVWTYDRRRGNGNTTGEDEPGGPTEGLMTSYGLSVHRISLSEWGIKDGPDYLYGHLGEAYGVLSHLLFDPATGDGIATIITGSADDPAKAPAGSSPLYRVEEDILRWWLDRLQ